ncbi:MAG: hypothetical protein QXD13_00320 [Candidatus Pacearchaeota archaeon]
MNEKTNDSSENAAERQNGKENFIPLLKEREMSEKEKRVRSVTKIYYSNPKIIGAMTKFAEDREVVPRYFENFGKRPDKIQYPSDIIGLVNRGATSFHASEELWNDALKLNSDMTSEEQNELRKGWDLLIDVDSPFLDCSKIATKLIIAALEQHGVKNYGIKFSGSKGMHIIVPSKAFPKEFNGIETRKMFPEWARTICSYLMNWIRKDYNKQAAEILTDFDAIKRRTNLSKEDLIEVYCKKCERPARKGFLTKLKCPLCNFEIERRDVNLTKRKLRCLNDKCPGFLELLENEEYFYCDACKNPENEKKPLSSDKYPDYFEKMNNISAQKIANLDLVLVAPRHLFRMPYSLHEKTALASIVLLKNELDNFSPRDANPLNVKIRDFMPNSEVDEAKRLLAAALDWSKGVQKIEEKKYANYEKKEFEKIDTSKISEDIFPEPIKKLLRGLKDGKKRGLYILITFFKSLGFSTEYINTKIREWNKLNEPQLKEGYIKSQINWHLKQRKNILPPNYDKESFYKDLGLLDKTPDAKNPIAEIARRIKGHGLS